MQKQPTLLQSKRLIKRIVILEAFAVIIILCISILLGIFLGKSIVELRNSDDIALLDDYSLYEIPSEVFDIHGEKITEFFIVKRQIVLFSDIPKILIDTLILMEDKRFYDHHGLDVYSILRAAIRNVLAGKILEGGSSLTQQLVKLTHTNRKRSFGRKWLELWLAFQIEKRYTKNEIIEKYLNYVYFGHGVYGIRKAAEYFFAKNLKLLSLAEIAMLIALIPAPNYYSPLKNPNQAKQRQWLVLAEMVESHLASWSEVEDSYRIFWSEMTQRLLYDNIPKNVVERHLDKAPYFSEYVRQFVENDFKIRLSHVIAKSIRKQYPDLTQQEMKQLIHNRVQLRLLTGGFKIQTTLDLKKQRQAEKALLHRLSEQDKIVNRDFGDKYVDLQQRYAQLFNFLGLSTYDQRHFFQLKNKRIQYFNDALNDLSSLSFIMPSFGIPINLDMFKHLQKKRIQNSLIPKVQGSFVSIHPRTGHIVAMIGGRDFNQNQYNRVFAKRQPGSIFKIFVYASAFETGKFNADSQISDKPIRIYNSETRSYWSPGNISNRHKGMISLREAFKESVNTVAVRLTKQIGLDKLIKMSAKLLDIPKNEFHPYMSLSLGTKEVSPMQIAKAVSVFANNGKRVKPIGVLHILDRNANLLVDYEKEYSKQGSHYYAQSDALVSKELSAMMVNLMKDVVRDGTASHALKKYSFPDLIAGKTGTSQHNRDAWFVGFIPDLLSVVWVGFDQGGFSLGNSQFGSNVAAPVWGKFMSTIYDDFPENDFEFEPSKHIE